MTIVPVPLPDRAYDIHIGPDLLSRAAGFFAPLVRGKQVLIALDENVARPHGENLLAALADSPYQVEQLVLPAGEPTKCVQHLSSIWDKLATSRFGRDCVVVALGGGVTGDLVGFAAATYMRGVDFIQIPTSLLAMVDSSVGGKTGINHPLAKNLIGSFWQPRLVLADTDTLNTLPREERVAALAEIIKYGVIFDAEFFIWLEQNIAAVRELEPEALTHAVRRSCEIKAEVVVEDERESGLRKILNFGHTLGHAIENTAGYGIVRHGEAISIGMVAESELVLRRGGRPAWGDAEHARLVALTEAAGLPTRIPENLDLRINDLIAAARSDKKNRDGEIRYMLPARLGALEDVSATEAEAEAVLISAGAKVL